MRGDDLVVDESDRHNKRMCVAVSLESGPVGCISPDDLVAFLKVFPLSSHVHSLTSLRAF